MHCIYVRPMSCFDVQSLKTEFDEEEEDDSAPATNGSTASTSGSSAEAPARAEATRTFPTGTVLSRILVHALAPSCPAIPASVTRLSGGMALSCLGVVGSQCRAPRAEQSLPGDVPRACKMCAYAQVSSAARRSQSPAPLAARARRLRGRPTPSALAPARGPSSSRPACRPRCSRTPSARSPGGPRSVSAKWCAPICPCPHTDMYWVDSRRQPC